MTPGTRLGPYEVLSLLGAGGMGEVYRAKDSTLKREVALKVLPADVAKDRERLARFQREAEVLASLNHPHIAQIYGLEHAGDTFALVMELVDGEDLAQRIARGPIPLDEALPIARQIAEALEAAHEQGIVHRDLKPANIKVRADGTVKVLDFGLAKALDPDVTASTPHGLANSPTITSPAMTMRGMILGTAAYMSPEQARGRAVDKRTDIFAFGVVLYEMLTGRRAFDGEDVSLMLAAVMKSEPDLTALPPDLPATVRACLARCLQKDPRQRLRDMGDVRLVLQGEFESPATAPAAVVAPKTALWRRALPPIAAAIVAGVGVGLAVWYFRPPDPRPVTRFEHVLPGELLFRTGTRRSIAASPDGRRFVYNAADGVYLHSLDQPGDRQLLASTGPVSNPVFSPDGQAVAYHQSGQLKRLATTGGAPVVIATTPSPNGVSWAEDGTLLYAAPEGINRVPAQGGTPELIVRALDGETLLSPQILPGGQTVLFSSVRAGNVVATGTVNQREPQAVAQSLRSGERKVLMQGASDARYVHSGHLVYTVGDGLFAVGFDAKAIAVVGGAVSILEGIRRGSGPTPVALAEFDVSGDGALFYLGGAGNLAGSPLAWVSRDGRAEPIAAIPPHGFTSPRLSADGQRLLVVAQGDVRIYDLATGRETRVTSDRAAGSYAEWVPGDQAVTYSSTRSGQGGLMNIWMQPLDGSGRATQMTNLDGQVHVDSWTPDGRVLAAHLHHQQTGSPDIFLFQGAEVTSSKPTKLVENSTSKSDAVFSPDGRFVAYLDAVSGQTEVVIRPFPGPGHETPVSVGGGREAFWSRNGELFYRRTSDDMMTVVRVATTPALTVGPPRELFRGAGTPGGSPRPSYSVTADGQRFIMSAARVASGLQRDAAAARPRINIVLNWVEELKARVPTGKQ